MGALMSAMALAGCSGPGSGAGAGAEPAGVAVFAITNAPSDAACLQITAAGSRTVVKSFSLSPGQDAVFTLSGLPVGNVVFSELAFAQDCSAVTASSVPTWVSDPVPATITPGVVAQV